jgi:hypothetical protein
VAQAIRVRTIADEERAEITRLAHAHTASVRLAERARIVDVAGQGESVVAIASALWGCVQRRRASG